MTTNKIEEIIYKVPYRRVKEVEHNHYVKYWVAHRW